MSGFRLHAVGELFDVDLYLTEYKIDYSSIWYKDKGYQNSGFVKYLGNEYELDIYEQEKIAYEYMRMNKDSLKALVNWKNVDMVILGLSYEFKVFPTVGTCLSFSPTTIALAAEIGLKLAFYIEASIDEENWDAPLAEDY
jgi:hypothetical protein